MPIEFIRPLDNPLFEAVWSPISTIKFCYSSIVQKIVQAKFSKDPYYFDGSISREVLENYLDRSVTMGYFLVPGTPEGYQLPYKHDDIRMIKNMGAKFIGRAIYRWSEESKLNDPVFLAYAKAMIDTVHAFDPEVIFQGCLFEFVSPDVNNLKIPAWVFTEFGLPIENRTFSSDSIVKRKGRVSTRMGGGGVPIINNRETQLWFFTWLLHISILVVKHFTWGRLDSLVQMIRI
jgi:hypothetical protein